MSSLPHTVPWLQDGLASSVQSSRTRSKAQVNSRILMPIMVAQPPGKEGTGSNADRVVGFALLQRADFQQPVVF